MLKMFVSSLSLYNIRNRGVFLLCKITNLLIYRFVYILSQQQENFLHELAKNKIEFVPMYETDVIFYPGRQTEFYDSGKEKVRMEELEGIRFIQNYQDEFFDLGSVQENAFQWRDLG